MITATFAWPAGQPDLTDLGDHRPLCAGGCGRRTAGLLVDTCPDARCLRTASAAEWRRDRWADR